MSSLLDGLDRLLLRRRPTDQARCRGSSDSLADEGVIVGEQDPDRSGSWLIFVRNCQFDLCATADTRLDGELASNQKRPLLHFLPDAGSASRMPTPSSAIRSVTPGPDEKGSAGLWTLRRAGRCCGGLGDSIDHQFGLAGQPRQAGAKPRRTCTPLWKRTSRQRIE